MSELLKLAERCEAAPGPDRELDRLIEETLPGVLEHPDTKRFADERKRDPYVISGEGHPDYEPGQGFIPSRYTASLDAAMTLVPEGCLQPSDIVREALNRLGKHFSLHTMHWPLLTPYAEYLARFVSAAALRARATLTQGDAQ